MSIIGTSVSSNCEARTARRKLLFFGEYSQRKQPTFFLSTSYYSAALSWENRLQVVWVQNCFPCPFTALKLAIYENGHFMNVNDCIYVVLWSHFGPFFWCLFGLFLVSMVNSGLFLVLFWSLLVPLMSFFGQF